MVVRRLIIGLNKLLNPQTFRKPVIPICLCQNYMFSSRIKSNYRSDTTIFKKEIISSLNFKCKEDAEPFYKLNTKTLIHISKVTKNDIAKGYCDNRLYYLSSKIKCTPAVLSEKLAKRTFVYQLSFDWLESSLNVLLEMGVPGDRILRDLWVLKYHHLTIKERLQKVKDSDVQQLFPWMVRCTPDILNKYITLSQETKNILGENKSPEMYLAERLNTTIEVVQAMHVKLPTLKTIRIPKLKAFLDFLIDEGFSVEEITYKPRILAASQKTVKQRLDKLRELGLSCINLNILCRSRKDFQKYLESVSNVMKESDQQKSINDKSTV